MAAFLDEKLAEAFDGETFARIHEGYEEALERPVTLRANALKSDAASIAVCLGAAGIAYERVPWYEDAFILLGSRERDIRGLPVYEEGDVYLQSLSSMLPPLVLEPRPGADVLDMCAAPGGKTSQIAALACGKARITACEMNGPRAEKLSYNLRKLGVAGVNIMKTDARQLDEFFRFDQVLLDAPCTGSGTVHPGDEQSKRITSVLLDKTTRSQFKLLDRALTVLKPQGTLVYSTCSILPEENGRQVERALAKHADCRIAPIESIGDMPIAQAPFETLPGGPEGTLTVCPSRLYEGFYIARLKKAAR